MGKSVFSIFKHVLFHPLKFCEENEEWDGSGPLMGFGVLMFSFSLFLQLLRVLTTDLLRSVDIFVGLYSVFIFYILFPIGLFVGSAIILELSLRLFGEPDIRKTVGALETSSIVLVLLSFLHFIAVRTSDRVLVLSLPLLVLFWGLLLFQSFRNAHNLSFKKTTLVLGAPFLILVLIISLKPDLLIVLDLLHDSAWKLYGFAQSII